MSTVEYPRVRRIIYSLMMATPDVHFEIEIPIEGVIGHFKYSIGPEVAIFQPTVRFADEEAALAELTPVLDAWELKYSLDQERWVFHFFFYRCEIEESPSGPEASSGDASIFSGYFPGSEYFPKFPDLPSDFSVDGLTRDLVQIFLSARMHRASLLKDAYGFYTRLMYEFKSEANAAEQLQVTAELLAEIKKLATQRSYGAHTRKWLKPGKEMPPLIADHESAWLGRAMGAVARRCGEVAAGKTNLAKLKRHWI